MNNLAINSKGNLLVSCGEKQDIILWNTNFKSEGNLINVIFDQLHENQIDVIAFAPLEAAQSITRFMNERRKKDAGGE